MIRWYGAEGLRAHIRGHVGLAQEFASWVAADDRFELVAPHELSLVTFRLRAGDDATRALMDQVNASGEMYLTHTLVDGKVALRMAIGATLTERRHVEPRHGSCCRTVLARSAAPPRGSCLPARR